MSDENVLHYRGGEVYDKSVTKVVIATGVTKINYNTFFGCADLQSVVFQEPHQVTEIDQWAFYGCHALESIELPKSLVEIGSWAFSNCLAVRRIVIPGCVTLGSCAFEESGIEEIFLSDGVKSIERGAFSDCSRLHTVRLPASIKEIRFRAFDCCWNLENVIVPSDGLPLLKRLELGGAYESRGWEEVRKIARKAPNLTSLSLSWVKVGSCKLDDGDIPLVIEMVSSCPHLESLDLSYNAFSDQAIRTLDSEGILGRLRDVDFRNNHGTVSAKERVNFLQKNLRLVIWTDHKCMSPKDERLIDHYLDMNRFGCRDVPIANVSMWPRLIDRLGTIAIRRQLNTCPASVLYHLLSEQNNDLCNYYQQNRLLLDEHHSSAEEDNEGDGVKRRRLL